MSAGAAHHAAPSCTGLSAPPSGHVCGLRNTWLCRDRENMSPLLIKFCFRAELEPDLTRTTGRQRMALHAYRMGPTSEPATFFGAWGNVPSNGATQPGLSFYFF